MGEVVDLSIIVPCFNEQDNVARLVEAVGREATKANVSYEVLLVDDGSTDNTWSEITLAAESMQEVLAARHNENQGLAAAWRTGLVSASGRYACFFDADMQHQPRDIFTLYRTLLISEVDIVQGVRSMVGRPRDHRWFISRTLNLLLNIVFRLNSKDSKSGFLLAPRHVLKDLVDHRGRYSYFQTFVSVAAAAKGYSVLEIDTSFRERRAGQSFLAGHKSVVVSAKALADFFPALLEFGGRRHPYGSWSIAPRFGAKSPHPYRGWRRALFEAYFATMPLHKWTIRRSARRLYLELKATEYSNRDQLDEIQAQKLQRLIQHAYNHVPLYRSRMDEKGIHPTDVALSSDVSRLPLLNKADVREHLYFDLFSRHHREGDLLKITTSGSTGEPFTTYGDRYQLEMRFASTLRALEWTGWRFGDRQARLWHQTLGMTRSQIVRERIDAWFMRRLFIPAFEISPENIGDFVERIRSHRPLLIDGYAESLNFLARYVESGSNPGFHPKAVMSSAQALPYGTRRAIEDGFGAKVFDKYGSREFSGIAYQCESSHDHHVMDESYLVEVLVDERPARPGETGEVVITDLNNFSVPLIRYRIGDLAVAVDNSTKCACGRSSRRIGEIAGRTQAIVHCKDGTWIPGTFFAHFFKDYEDVIRQFQIVQEMAGAFDIRVVLAEDASAELVPPVLERLRDYVGETQIGVEFVDEIPLVRTGKRSPVVSNVQLDFQSVGSEISEKAAVSRLDGHHRAN